MKDEAEQLDPVTPLLVELLRSGRARIVGREDYVVNGRTLAKLSIELDDDVVLDG